MDKVVKVRNRTNISICDKHFLGKLLNHCVFFFSAHGHVHSTHLVCLKVITILQFVITIHCDNFLCHRVSTSCGDFSIVEVEMSLVKADGYRAIFLKLFLVLCWRGVIVLSL